jgi:glyoxylase-like metal-dependent hydrolase (beta-lactamase superfamily II)
MAVTVAAGDARISGLVDRRHPLDPAWHYPDVPAQAWEPYRLLLLDEAWSLLDFRAFLVQADERTILIDTGWGPVHAPPGAPATPAALLEELASLGVGVADIDTVVFTHLHADHVGWNLELDGDRPRPRFSRARYLVPAADWAHYNAVEQMHPNIREQALPLGGLGVLDLYEGEHQVSPSLRALPTPGHSPGHSSFVLSSAGEHCFVLGDLAHHPIVAQETGWVHRFDWRPEAAVAQRRAVLERLERDATLVAAGHFPHPGFGRFVRVNGRRIWRPVAV